MPRFPRKRSGPPRPAYAIALVAFFLAQVSVNRTGGALGGSPKVLGRVTKGDL